MVSQKIKLTQTKIKLARISIKNAISVVSQTKTNPESKPQSKSQPKKPPQLQSKMQPYLDDYNKTSIENKGKSVSITTPQNSNSSLETEITFNDIYGNPIDISSPQYAIKFLANQVNSQINKEWNVLENKIKSPFQKLQNSLGKVGQNNAVAISTIISSLQIVVPQFLIKDVPSIKSSLNLLSQLSKGLIKPQMVNDVLNKLVSELGNLGASYLPQRQQQIWKYVMQKNPGLSISLKPFLKKDFTNLLPTKSDIQFTYDPNQGSAQIGYQYNF